VSGVAPTGSGQGRFPAVPLAPASGHDGRLTKSGINRQHLAAHKVARGVVARKQRQPNTIGV